jgi:hypothetical protein
MLQSSLLSQLDWLTHGFGTRLDAISQDEMASLKQIHSATVLEARSSGILGEGDALITGQPGLPVSIRTADCYPVLLVDTRHRAVAAIHAGWRGTAAGIVPKTLAAMGQKFGTTPDDILAAVGPGIGSCCYEVGAEVAEKFGKPEAGCIDLAEANRAQLTTAGVECRSIDILGGCTRCDSTQFHSFRRDKTQAGRMISYIQIA